MVTLLCFNYVFAFLLNLEGTEIKSHLLLLFIYVLLVNMLTSKYEEMKTEGYIRKQTLDQSHSKEKFGSSMLSRGSVMVYV